MINMKAAVDAVEVPEPSSKYKPRKPGATKPGPPERHTNPNYALRKWMVDPEVLAKNPEWLRGGRVVDNGELWGEEEPEDTRTSQKRKKITTRKKGTIPVAEVKKARQQLDEAVNSYARDLEGESLNELRERLTHSAAKGKGRAPDDSMSGGEGNLEGDEDMDDF